MNINLRKLQAISSLTQTLSFSKTADAFCMTQPGLSRLVKGVESTMGVKLFLRTTRSVEITREGRALLPIINRLIEDYESNMSELAGTARLQTQSIAIAALPSLCAFILPSFLKELKSKFPALILNVFDVPADGAIALLQDQKVDFALSTLDHADTDLHYSVVGEDDFVLLCPAGTGAKLGFDRWDENLLNELSLISMARGTSTRDAIDLVFLKRGMEFRPALELTNLMSIARFVKEGFGIGLLPRFGARLVVDSDLEIIGLKSAPRRSIGIIKRRLDIEPEHIKAAMEALKSNLKRQLGKR